MPKLSVYNISGQATGEEIELNDLVFGVEFNEAVVHQAIVMQQAAERQGTSATKTRGMVRGGGRKPWRQKGTGRARSGSTRSPIWVGGGTTFGPQPRSYAKKMPRKARRLAIRCALSAKVAAGELIVVEGLSFDAPKTKNVVLCCLLLMQLIKRLYSSLTVLMKMLSCLHATFRKSLHFPTVA